MRHKHGSMRCYLSTHTKRLRLQHPLEGRLAFDERHLDAVAGQEERRRRSCRPRANNQNLQSRDLLPVSSGMCSRARAPFVRGSLVV